MTQGKSPRNPLAFASVLYPGRCLAVELATSLCFCGYQKISHDAERAHNLEKDLSRIAQLKVLRTICVPRDNFHYRGGC